VQTLRLRGCYLLVDMSALGRVRKINLACCYGVVDVSALGQVEELDLFGCAGIKDYSAAPHAKRECVSSFDFCSF